MKYSDSADVPNALIPQRYRVLKTSAQDGAGTLLHVRDLLRQEELAARVVCTPVDERAAGYQEFLRLLTIDHPSLSRVYDFGSVEAGVFYTRELTSQFSITEALEHLDDRQLYSCLEGAAGALAALHENGTAHGLMLPDYIRVARKGNQFGGIRVTDAGLRHLLSREYLQRAHRYDSPDVRAGAAISPASDLYQLAATLIEVVAGSNVLSVIERGVTRGIRSRMRGIDRRLVDLLLSLIAPDRQQNPANGQELLRIIRMGDWVLPEREWSVESLLTPVVVGREMPLSRLGAILERAETGEIHALEILGAPGMGRSRLLAEFDERARSAGWATVHVHPTGIEDPIGALVMSVEAAIGQVLPDLPVSQTDPRLNYHRYPNESPDTLRFAESAAAIFEILGQGSAKLVLLIDDADQLVPDLLTVLRYVVTEAGTQRILIAATGVQPIDLPGSEIVSIGPLGKTTLRRLIAPLLAISLNPDETLAALQNQAGGNPLWVRLLLASWIESEQLRFVRGRAFFNEKGNTAAPQTITDVVGIIVAGLSEAERRLVEALAVWGRPLSLHLVEKIAGQFREAGTLVAREGELVGFIGDTVGPVVYALLPEARRRYWHAAFIETLEEHEMERGQRGVHLIGAGRTGEGIRELVELAGEDEARLAHHAAFDHLRTAVENLPLGKRVSGVDRVRVVLDASRLATVVGELRWARERLSALEPEVEGINDPGLRLEYMLSQANVLRELRHASDALQYYAKARSLAEAVPELRDRLSMITLEEAANDASRGEGEVALRRIEPIVERLRQEGDSPLLGLALKRMASVQAHLGRSRSAAHLELRCARLARRLGDSQLATRAFITLGHLYHRLGRPQRALQSLDRAQAHLLQCPHDGHAAAELVNRAQVLISLGQTEEAESVLLRAQALRQRSGQRGRLAGILIDLGRLRRLRGRLSDGVGYYREAILLAEEFDVPLVHVGRANLGELFLHQGEHVAAEETLRIALTGNRPDHRGLILVNLGRLYRKRGEYARAFKALEEAADLLSESRASQAPHAKIEMARVLVASGDVLGAESQLARTRDEMGDNNEQHAEYQLALGLVAAGQGDSPIAAFECAVAAGQKSNDPTLLGETLIDALECAMAVAEPDHAWIYRHLRLLEETAAHTDALPVTTGLRILRASVPRAIDHPIPAAADQLGRGFIQNLAQRPEKPFDVALGDIIHDMEGATGAVVFVVGLGPDGRTVITPIPKSHEASPPIPKPHETALPTVRPYRIAAREFDRQIFRDALIATGGNALEAARLLRLPTSTFRYRAEKLKLLKPIRRDSTQQP